MLYNILPGGNTFLHKISKREDMLLKIFDICHPYKNGEYTTNYHIPVLPNLKGETALHTCVKNNDFKTLDTMLKYLRLYGIDHHSRSIKDLIPIFIEKQLPEFLSYLDSRMLQTD
jgi:ankyrin repeat protein